MRFYIPAHAKQMQIYRWTSLAPDKAMHINRMVVKLCCIWSPLAGPWWWNSLSRGGIGYCPQEGPVQSLWVAFKNDSIPGDSSRALFGMVICDPFKWLSDLQLGGWKGHFESPGTSSFSIRNIEKWEAQFVVDKHRLHLWFQHGYIQGPREMVTGDCGFPIEVCRLEHWNKLIFSLNDATTSWSFQWEYLPESFCSWV